MILVLGGTTEAKQVTELLVQENIPVVVSTAYDFAKDFIQEHPLIETISGKLDSSLLEHLIQEKGIEAIVDATHPFALEITENAEQACLKTGVKYIRLERADAKNTFDVPYDKLHHVDSIVDAARLAGSLGRVLFFAIGSSGAQVIADNIDAGCVRYIRILPHETSKDKCLKAGFKESEIITGVGPFSYKDNYELWERLKVDVVVTKESGTAGGFFEKIDAARDLDIHVVVVSRPKVKSLTIMNAEEIKDYIKTHFMI